MFTHCPFCRKAFTIERMSGQAKPSKNVQYCYPANPRIFRAAVAADKKAAKAAKTLEEAECAQRALRLDNTPT